MRKKHPIDAIISGARQKILAAVLRQPGRWWYLSDLARYLKSTPSSLQRELASLANAGVLEKSREGKQIYFRADENCPFLTELRGLFLKTAGMVDVLHDALGPFESKIGCAFIYGSIAKGQEGSRSDIDLMIIGNIGLSALALPLRDAQELLQRPVNPIVLAPNELKEKIGRKNHFLRNVLSRSKIFVIGNEKDLERLAG
jgi:predicted nucleotidyltransferase